ncbi:MAG: YgiQ family radical SAM protein, partial [Candidatus Omnitrophica bacterium]|nr:YgiQ family radical SAM protein [Candidatus Omnitrophota bacterium]
LKDYIILPSFEEVKENKTKFLEAFKIFYEENDPIRGKVLVQKHSNLFVIQNPPARPLTRQELDLIYALPFTRRHHPSYEKSGGVKALETVKFSITSHRGCLANCSFCSIAIHQGRIIQSRSPESIIEESKKLSQDKDFKGVITDIGGPTANMYMANCKIQSRFGNCKDRDCLLPSICENLKLGDKETIELLRRVRSLAGIKHVFVSTGVRYDLCLVDKDLGYLKEICKHHVSGQLKVAPEHIVDSILRIMNKPAFKVYKKFIKAYNSINKSLNKKQYLVQYFITSHPGCTLGDMFKLALYIKSLGYYLEQIQDFTPTPMTLSSCMYYTAKNPFTLKNIYIPSSNEERRMQRALIQFKNPKNYKYVKKALKILGKKNLFERS